MLIVAPQIGTTTVAPAPSTNPSTVAATTALTTTSTGELHQTNLLTESSFRETAQCLLKRLIGSLGNVNAIKDVHIHRKIFEFISTKWERLNKVIIAKLRLFLEMTPLQPSNLIVFSRSLSDKR